MKIEDSIYRIGDMIGSLVRLRNLPINNVGEVLKCKKIRYTIKDVLFRVDRLGVTTTLFEFEELPGRYFNPYGTTIEYINMFKNSDAMCGKFMCGDALCGYNVSTTPDGSISIIDDFGNIIKDRYVYFENTDVEDPSTDPDNITNMTVNIDGGVV